MKEKEVASGLYWNYFYHSWKTVAHSPFANAVVFVENDATITDLASFTLNVTDVSKVGTATVINMVLTEPTTLQQTSINFVQTEDTTEDGVAVQKFGSYIVPKTALEKTYTLEATIKGTQYATASAIGLGALAVGDTVTFAKQ